jgi:uncharacterized protein (TIGR00369 family)
LINSASDSASSDVAAQAARAFTDEELLARFQRTTRRPTGSQTLGFRMLSVDQARRRVEVAFEANAETMANPMRQIQGGFLCAMLDECMSVACMVASGMTSVAPTPEMKTSFLRPAFPGALRGVGAVLRWGKTIAFTEGELYDAEGRMLAKASGTALPTPFKSYK